MKFESELPKRNEDGSYTVNWEAQWTIPPEPTCGLWWLLSLVPSVLAIGAALGGLLWLVFGARG